MNAFIGLMIKGGWTMIPIMFCSLLALTIIIERIISLRKSRIIPPSLVIMIESFSSDRIKPIIDYCSSLKQPFSSIVKTLLLNSHLSKEETSEIVKITGRQESALLDRGLFILDLVANIAPLLGLLGTVLGMIDIFDIISRGSLGQSEALSAGIAKALITTVAGLVVGIPSLAAYTFFIRKVDSMVLEMDKHITCLHGKMYGINIE